jgi:predicted metal-dependent phosphotriesterase family hydrolase
VRFHIIAEHILCEEVATVQDPDGFNSHLNVEQLNKSLVTLFHMYAEHADRGDPLPHEAELRAYMLLLQLDRHGKYDFNPEQVRTCVQCSLNVP